MENPTTIAIDLSKNVGVQWELPGAVARRKERFVIALASRPHSSIHFMPQKNGWRAVPKTPARVSGPPRRGRQDCRLAAGEENA
jgi:hypothetical protein